MSSPTLFVLGCWGAGKSTLGRALEPHGFRHDHHGLDFWKASNLDLRSALSQPHYEPYRVTRFAQCRFVGGDALAAIALDRIRSPVPSRLST